MAIVSGLTKEKTLSELGEMVVGINVVGGGNIDLVLKNGTVRGGGNLNTAIASVVTTEVRQQIAGTAVNLGDFAGALTQLASKTNGALVNALVTIRLTGPVTLSSSDLPTDAAVGTQFAMRCTQDATGGRTLTLSGIKASYGVLFLSTSPDAVDLVVFMYDGTTWYAGLMGADFS